jgi:hypothetical protein
MRRRWVFIAAALLGGGLAGVSLEDSHHNACTSGLGPFGSLSGDLARNCTLDNTIFLAAFAATLVGLALMVAALLIRP